MDPDPRTTDQTTTDPTTIGQTILDLMMNDEIDSDPTTTDLCKRFNNLQLAFLAHSDLVTVRAFSEIRGFSFAPLMISKPENIPCMTTTTTDGGSICVKVMRQLRCR